MMQYIYTHIHTYSFYYRQHTNAQRSQISSEPLFLTMVFKILNLHIELRHGFLNNLLMIRILFVVDHITPFLKKTMFFYFI